MSDTLCASFQPMHCTMSCQSLWVVFVPNLYCACACYFRASNQNSDTAVGFGNPDFLYFVGKFTKKWINEVGQVKNVRVDTLQG